MIRYTHTQQGGPVRSVLVVAGAVLLAIALLGGDLPLSLRVWFAILALFAGWIGSTFSRLTVEVSDRIRVFFGARWPQRVISPERVTGVAVVRNSPWYGFGIRWIGRGWLWNVWGLDAVQLDFDDGRRMRIGTDQPAELLAAIGAIVSR